MSKALNNAIKLNDIVSVTDFGAVGEVQLHSAPAASGNIGWVCTTSGSPGTWKTFGAIAA